MQGIVTYNYIYMNYLNVVQLVDRFLVMMGRYPAKAQALQDASSNLAVKIIHISVINLFPVKDRNAAGQTFADGSIPSNPTDCIL